MDSKNIREDGLEKYFLTKLSEKILLKNINRLKQLIQMN